MLRVRAVIAGGATGPSMRAGGRAGSTHPVGSNGTAGAKPAPRTAGRDVYRDPGLPVYVTVGGYCAALSAPVCHLHWAL
eukprot:SAG22_NODE_2804_length_2198_cov_1.545498_2_plen_79_part_00